MEIILYNGIVPFEREKFCFILFIYTARTICLNNPSRAFPTPTIEGTAKTPKPLDYLFHSVEATPQMKTPAQCKMTRAQIERLVLWWQVGKWQKSRVADCN